MDEHHSWYNGSVWHIHSPYQVYVGQWPLFYGPAILLHILKTIWWRNVVLGIMDHCDSKIDLVKYMWVNDLYFMVLWFYLISLLDLNYFYTLRNGTSWGIRAPVGTCSSFFFKCSKSHDHAHISWKTSKIFFFGWWPWNLVYGIGYSSTTNVFIWWPWVDRDHFYDRAKFLSECFCMDESVHSIEC